MTFRLRKGIYRPASNKENLIIFLDDIHMPTFDRFGAQPCFELIRQWLDYSGWYNLETQTWNIFEKMTFVGAYMPARNAPCSRF